MQIQKMFVRDINRDINGVIKVDQEDGLVEELSEYIVTKELREAFTDLFNRYTGSLDQPTDKIGVWIAGFFGSGKSHFLKMTSHLLSNKEANGKKALDYFREKLADDPLLFANIEKAVAVPTESILFNIGLEGTDRKDRTSVLRAFAKMFHKHLGYYGEDFKTVRLEKYIAKKGKTDEFRAVFEEESGTPWLESRDTYEFQEDAVITALQKVLGMSETSARNWLAENGTQEISPASFVSEVKEYILSKGSNFRLLFMVDEIGQYIGDDAGMMLDLQSIAEGFGTQCRGQVWLMVTSQEKIDELVKVQGDDFSKIQGRFNTQIKLSSSSIDEVIKKRLLEKTEDAKKTLKMVFDKESDSLKNIFSFSGNSKGDIKGYQNESDFTASFPFVSYQFLVLPHILSEIRKHGNSGKHLSGGERSMLSGFQEAALKVKEKDEKGLVPFHYFYDTIHTFLDSQIRRVIERCKNAADNDDRIKPIDVEVLKLLYMICYIGDEIPATVENVTILMVDSIDVDKIKLRKSVEESLARLVHENYVARNGETYRFLTDYEQDISREIQNTDVPQRNLTSHIAKIIFDDIFPDDKYTYNNSVFNFTRRLDDQIHGTAKGEITLHCLTTASGIDFNSKDLTLASSKNLAVIPLSDEYPYYEDLLQAAKIRTYVKQHNVQQNELLMKIVQGWQDEAGRLEANVKNSLTCAILKANVFVCGQPLTESAKSSTPKEKFSEILEKLVETVYRDFGKVNKSVGSDKEIRDILNGKNSEPALWDNYTLQNEDALLEVGQWLDSNVSLGTSVTMADLLKQFTSAPHGWREIDIAALTAALIADRKIEVFYAGTKISSGDPRLTDYLRARTHVSKTVLKRRQSAAEFQINQTVNFLRGYLPDMNIPAGEEELAHLISTKFTDQKEQIKTLLLHYQGYSYPGKPEAENALRLVNKVLAQKDDSIALFKTLLDCQDALPDAKEDLEEIARFFRTQKDVYDKAAGLSARMERETDYIEADPELTEKLGELREILAMPKPYRMIQTALELCTDIRDHYKVLLEAKQRETETKLANADADAESLAEGNPKAAQPLAVLKSWIGQKLVSVKNAVSMTDLDAVPTQIQTRFNQFAESLVPEPSTAPAPERTAQISRSELCDAKILSSREEIDDYAEEIRAKLRALFGNKDQIRIV